MRVPLKDENLSVKRVWCSKAKNTYLAIIEVVNIKTDERYLMSAGMSNDGLLGQSNE